MGRSPCCSKKGLNKGAWTAMEDKILTEYIKKHGEGKWRHLPKRAGLKRCGKSCRLRWLNYLRPGIKRGNITNDEEELIIRLHRLLGNRWSLIAGRLPGRTDNEIKNYWNTTIGRKLQNGTQNCSITSGAHSLAQQNQSLKPLNNKGSLVVQTKATRLTKVKVTKEISTQQNEGFESNMVDNKMNGSPTLPSSPSEHENDPLDNFMESFEMDGNLFSELLMMDLPDLMEDSGNPSTIGKGHLSPKSSNDDTYFFTCGDSLYDHSGFDFIESGFDWL